MATQQQNVILPAPPRYTEGMESRDYANQMNRWLDNLHRYATGVVYLRGNGLYLPGLPTTGYGLSPDEVFSNGGILTIVRAGDVWAGPLSATATVGTVTVS
jgi:hypothetical protein